MIYRLSEMPPLRSKVKNPKSKRVRRLKNLERNGKIYRICTLCAERKELNENFYTLRNGHQARCKSCQKTHRSKKP